MINLPESTPTYLEESAILNTAFAADSGTIAIALVELVASLAGSVDSEMHKTFNKDNNNVTKILIIIISTTIINDFDNHDNNNIST